MIIVIPVPNRQYVYSMKTKRIIILLFITCILILLVFGARKFFQNTGSGDMLPDTKESSTQTISTTTERVYSTTREAPPSPPGDIDADGLLDDEERVLGTSLVNADTDRDGISDKDERDIWHTDPTKKDTDGDGFADLIEIMNGYNPSGEGLLTQ